MKTTIAKALKEKNKIVNKINVLSSKIKEHNCEIEGSTQIYNVKDLLENLVKEKSNLVILKAAIFEANAPIYKDILTLSEYKSHLKFLNSIEIQEGIKRDRYSEKEFKYKSQLTSIERDKLVEEYQNKVDELQEKIDVFNHTNYITY